MSLAKSVVLESDFQHVAISDSSLNRLFVEGDLDIEILEVIVGRGGLLVT